MGQTDISRHTVNSHCSSGTEISGKHWKRDSVEIDMGTQLSSTQAKFTTWEGDIFQRTEPMVCIAIILRNRSGETRDELFKEPKYSCLTFKLTLSGRLKCNFKVKCKP